MPRSRTHPDPARRSAPPPAVPPLPARRAGSRRVAHLFLAAGLWIAGQGGPAAGEQEAPAPFAPAGDVVAEPTPLPTPEPTPPVSPERALLERLHAAYVRVQTAEATFRQRRVSRIFLEEIHLTGSLRVAKPGRLRLDYAGDDDSQTLYLGDKVYLYSPALRQVDVVSLEGRASSIDRLNLQLLGFAFDLDEVFSVYRVTLEGSEVLADGATSSTLRLDPLQPAETQLLVARLSLLEAAPAPPAAEVPAEEAPDPGAAPMAAPTAPPTIPIRPVHLTFEESNGDTNEMFLDEIRINVDLEAALFVPSYPDDVSIVSP